MALNLRDAETSYIANRTSTPTPTPSTSTVTAAAPQIRSQGGLISAIPMGIAPTTLTNPNTIDFGGMLGSVTGTVTPPSSPTPSSPAPRVTGGAPAPSPVPQPAAAPEAVETVTPAGGGLEDFSEDEISAALASIEAEFGMTREQLLSDQGLIGAQYRLLLARLERQRALSASAVTDDAVGRGIYRSGILGENLADVEQQFVEQASAAETNRLQAEQSAQAQLDALSAQEQAAKALREAEIRGEVNDIRRRAAGV